jgi:hypothetical protein
MCFGCRFFIGIHIQKDIYKAMQCFLKVAEGLFLHMKHAIGTVPINIYSCIPDIYMIV